jgi:hypothetical protein
MEMSRGLLRNTVRIDVTFTNGTGTGTGFMFSFLNTSNFSRGLPAIVTCRHVVKGAVQGKLVFSQWSGDNSIKDTNMVEYDIPDFESRWIGHPDTNVDLCILPIGELLRPAMEQNIRLDFKMMDSRFLPSKDEMASLSVFQEVKFIGYPVGLRDEKNNLPIVRRGMMASDPSVDYNGQTKFLIDAAVFPGSSGSPVFVADEGNYMNGRTIVFGSRLKLIGIVSDAFEFNARGEVTIKEIPNAYDASLQMGIPINLGVAIKSERLKEFEPLLEAITHGNPQQTNAVAK